MENNKSVLFLMGGCGIGGVERVSIVLANEFASRGIFVAFCAFEFEEANLLSDLDKRVRVVELTDNWLSAANCDKLRQILIENKVTHIINQWCVPFKVTRFCRKAARGLNIKLYAVHHNLPTTNKKIQDSTGLRRAIWKLITAINLRLVYEFSDAYVLLSESFVDIFKRFIWKRHASKIRVITNPLTMTTVVRKKEKVILYVGRLEETQKRFSRVLGIWRELSKQLPDWTMEVVGDGPDRARYEAEARDVERIKFMGFQNPAEFYARAQLLLLTSDFEGFALVLVEAMASKCVPVVLGSYPAAYDIVRGGGMIIDMPYRQEAFVSAVLDLVKNPERLTKMQEREKEISDEYGVKPIADKWMKLFEEG